MASQRIAIGKGCSFCRAPQPITCTSSWLIRRDRRSWSSAPTKHSVGGQGQGPHDVLFCGTDAFAEITLRHIIGRKDLYRSLAVLTSQGKAEIQAWGASRMKHSPVKLLTDQHSLEHHTVPNEGLNHLTLPSPFSDRNSHGSSVLVTASFGHFVPPKLLGSFGAALNVHPSLLPKLRGAAPIQWAIARSQDPPPADPDQMSGVTIQSLSSDGFDRGSILLQQPFNMGQHRWTFYSLAPILAQLGAEALAAVLAQLPTYLRDAKPQDDRFATLAPKLRADKHASIRWDRLTAAQVDARSRGLSHQFPLASTLTSVQPQQRPVSMLFHDISLYMPTAGETVAELPALRSSDARPGHAVFSTHLDGGKGGLLVRCASRETSGEEQQFILATSMQQPGKKRRRIDREWWNGFRDRADTQDRLLFE